MNMGLKNKVVVITGGTRGIGAAAAELLLREGAQVAVCGSHPIRVEEINRRAEAEGLPLLAVTADISSPQQLARLFAATQERFGRIDVLINNAGMGCPDGFLTLQDPLWERELEVNLVAVVTACQQVLPYLERNGGGCILSVSSLCGRIAATVRSVYAVTKAGVNAYTRALALELKDRNIRVNAIAPGMVGTDMVKANHPDPEDYRSLGKSAMLQRMGEPEEIAAAMVFAVSDLAAGLNGQIIEVTGGKCVVQDPDYSWR